MGFDVDTDSISSASISRRLSPRNGYSFASFSSPRQLIARRDVVIREGNAYQAPVEDLDDAEAASSFMRSPTKLDDDYPEREECMWRPPLTSRNAAPIDDDTLMDYCRLANEHFGMNMEQSLFLLYAKRYNLAEAKAQLIRHVTIPSKFSDEDLNAFRFAYSCYGKNFSKIQQMMAHKSIRALVHHYYNTKQYETYKGSFDVENTGLADEDDVEDEPLTTTTTGLAASTAAVAAANDELKLLNAGGDADMLKICENCKAAVRQLFLVHELELCISCKIYFRMYNRHRPCRPAERPKRDAVCPADMRRIAAEFVHYIEPADMAGNFEDADDSGDLQIGCEQETRGEIAIREKKCEISKMRQEARSAETKANNEFKALECFPLSAVYQQARAFLERTAPPRARLQYSWEEAEKVIAFHALAANDSNFTATAELLGTKSADMVKSFYHEECRDEVKELTYCLDADLTDYCMDYQEKFRKLMDDPDVIEIDD